MDLHSLVSKLKELSRELNRTPTLREFVNSGVSKRQILKHKYSEIVRAAGLEPNKHAQTTEPIEPVIRPPRILTFDIETSAMLVKVYNLDPGYISHKNIKRPWHLLSYAARFRGEETIYYLDQRFAADVTDDRQLIEGLHDLISRADILCGHNLEQFDLKKFNTRAAFYRLPPIPDKEVWDTLKMLRRRYNLPSKSLDYAAKYFDLKSRKSSHGKFPGDMLWEECEAGNIEAWEECEKYNKQDVIVTEELFEFLAPHDPKINIQAYFYAPVCICGNKTFFKDGFKYSRQGKFQVRRCSNSKCSKTFVEKQNQVDSDLRKGFFK